MELLAVAFDRSFRKDLYPQVEEIQEKLGTINDHATARNLLEQWGTASGDYRELVAMEDQSLQTRGQEFRDWWSPERVRDMQRRFEKALKTTLAK